MLLENILVDQLNIQNIVLADSKQSQRLCDIDKNI